MIEAAQAQASAYLWVLRETLARSIEVHLLTMNRVNFVERYVELGTRKDKNRALGQCPGLPEGAVGGLCIPLRRLSVFLCHQLFAIHGVESTGYDH